MPEQVSDKIAKWRKRWETDSRWIDDVVACLRGQPYDRSARRIARLPWYTQKNGFRPMTFSPGHPTLILDLRGIYLRERDLNNIHLHFALLEGADFFKASLKNSDLSFIRGEGISFHQAQMDGIKLKSAHIPRADLTIAHAHNADLSNVNLDGADLGWVELDDTLLISASLSGANLEKASTKRADFSGARLIRANFTMANCLEAKFARASCQNSRFITAHAEKACFQGANLGSADFSIAHMEGADFSAAEIRNADFTRSWLSDSNFSGVNADSAIFSDAHLNNANFTDANLAGAELVSASLVDTNLKKTNLSSSDLSYASLVEANLEGADLRGSDLTDCTFQSAKKTALVDENTRFGFEVTESDRDPISHWLVPPLGKLERTVRHEIDPAQIGRRCNQVKLLFYNNGLPGRAASFSEQESYWITRDYRSQGNWWAFFSRLISLEYLTGYGGKPQRIIWTGIGIILLCAFSYLFGSLETGGRIINYDLFSGYVPMSNFIADFWYCLLFSMQCFCTLGLGIVKPHSGFSHAVASFEGLLGFLTIALGIVTYARRAGRV
ncbi:hypothetical protein CEE37_07050 [candidate division LCP-89 bacterium B3_LCP]|uniref:Potassium channel domain-containing protein n=1 Tax=candidate division LCP-89 bacterium B3_LCP TaxID=2012998 RepID=A0A532V0H8_UNCL8|nr:MAG: hypothetical protein CEE37_07050 [candidate division LCP-89 bacterium B3_LCP]